MSLVWRALILRIEKISFGLNRWFGIAQYTDHRPYLTESRDALFAACERIGRNLPEYFRPPGLVESSPSEPSLPVASSSSVISGVQTFHFRSPLASGIESNDEVEVRRFPARGVSEGTVMFHHPAFRRSLGWIEWFTQPLRDRFDIVAMSLPYHLSRTPAGTSSGERLVNPNPVHLYEGIRQWMADHHALIAILEREARDGRPGSAPVASVGYSLGAYLSLFYSQYDPKRPVAAICPTNDYGHVVFDGIMLPSLRRTIETAGFTRADWDRMTAPLRLDQYTRLIPAEKVLMICARYDAVESPESIQRLRDALRPSRTVLLPSGHSTTAVLYRGRIMREVLAFLDLQLG